MQGPYSASAPRSASTRLWRVAFPSALALHSRSGLCHAHCFTLLPVSLSRVARVYFRVLPDLLLPLFTASESRMRFTGRGYAS